MNKKEIQAKVRELLAAGTTKTEVFAQLTGQGVKDSQLAYFIASYADPNRCDDHERKVNILITIMFVQALIAFFLGFGIGAKIGPHAMLVVGALIALIPLLFAWGFFAHRVGAYNAYIFLTIIQLPRSFEGFASSPVATSIAIAFNVAILAYVWYVREKLFPDFSFITPKKVKGEYVFSG
jgi:hypothetical protein